jgi:hypothetical protein
MSNAQRRATRRYRERRSSSGFKRLEVQVPTSEAAVIKKAAAVLREQSKEAARLREHLGFETPSDRRMSAADVFAAIADEHPLSEEGERLWDEAMAQVARDRKDPLLNKPRKVRL